MPFPIPASLHGPGRHWIRVGTLLNGVDAPLRDAHLVYDAETIVHAGADAPRASQLRDGQVEPDAWLPEFVAMPGLIESHAHLFLEGGERDPARRAEYLKQSDAELAERAMPRLKRLLEIGVIAVRDAGDRNGVGLALQHRYRSSGRPAMPYLDSPGAAIHHQGRYGSFMGRPMEEYPSVQACVDGRIADGAYRIKLLATGIINFEKGAVVAKPQMPVEELAQFTAAARNRGRQTFAHCSGNDGVTNCVAARVDSIEHGFFVDAVQLAQMRDADIGWVPTFAPVQFQVDHASTLGWSATVRDNLQRILDGHAASLAHAARIGVRIIAGSDAGSHGVPHGWGLLAEMAMMEKAGMTPWQVVNAATGAPAMRLGFAEKFGLLQAGAKSRFILTGHSPLESVRNLTRPKHVFFDGAIFSDGDDENQAGL